jgi:NhaA family Na+:H+ antiporter
MRPPAIDSFRRGGLGRFFEVEAASGMVLLLATAAALGWANSAWRATYEIFWQWPGHDPSLRWWVNDGLMSIFFLVVGLEIRGELHDGALCGLRQAMVPLVAAAGGVLTPALLYLAMTSNAGLERGWAIPTPTDIAFAIGVLTVLGKRVPSAARVLLLALAVIDDVAAVLIIGLFYASGIGLPGLLLSVAAIAMVLLFQRLGIRSARAYLLPGAILWLGLLLAGVHPTLTGVILGLLTPPVLVGTDPPLRRIQRALHPWVAFGVMPLFALANAGLALGSFMPGSAQTATLTAAIVVALVIGKPLGIGLFTWATARSGLISLPAGLNWRGVVLVGCLGGIGFTMSLFLTNLAFADPTLVTAAKSAVLLASAVAATAGLLLGRFVLLP